MPIVAGHAMGDTPRGHGCVSCGRTWLYMLDRKSHWEEGAPDIAHTGNLNAREVHELIAYEVERNEHIWRVTMGRESPLDPDILAAEVA